MPRPIAPHPFRPLTDAEYALLARHLPPEAGRPGRPAQDRRRTLDAIFWVACGRSQWKDLPEAFGRPYSASRALRRWSRSGHLDLLLTQVAGRTGADRLWQALAWRVARAWRRVSRLASLSRILLARRLGVLEALPAAPQHLPDPDLSNALQARICFALTDVHSQPADLFGALARLIGRAGGSLRHWRQR